MTDGSPSDSRTRHPVGLTIFLGAMMAAFVAAAILVETGLLALAAAFLAVAVLAWVTRSG